MSKSQIPGYDEGIALERKLREEIFLGIPADICGIKVNHVTPFLLARLCRMETAFLGCVQVTDAEIIRFLWALSVDFSTEADKREAFIESCVKQFGSIEYGWLKAEEAIDEFLKQTFFDGPKGGAESVPYVTSIAWLVYTMAKEPFRWTKEQTMHTPLREIYQYTRCLRLDKGGVLYNEFSDTIKAEWTGKLHREWLANKAKGDN